jgi:hypothetical protein
MLEMWRGATSDNRLGVNGPTGSAMYGHPLPKPAIRSSPSEAPVYFEVLSLVRSILLIELCSPNPSNQMERWSSGLL